LTIGAGLVSALAVVVALFSLWFLPRGARPGGTPAPAQLAQADQDKLQGGWQVVSIEKGGEALQTEGMRFVFAGGELSLFIEGAQGQPEGYVLDPSQQPKAIDLSLPNGMVVRGIYQLDGDSFKLCLDQSPPGGGGKRPTVFRTQPDAPDTYLYVLRRERAGPGRP
jgi:uncharacterized protein (TIGR03067 family)